MGLKRKKTPDGDPDPNPDPEPDNSLQEARTLQLSALKNSNCYEIKLFFFKNISKKAPKLFRKCMAVDNNCFCTTK